MSDDAPLFTFRFLLEFEDSPLSGSGAGAVDLVGGAFSECTGLEGTMEAKVIREGGRNYGVVQRVGQVTFATVVLKRGIAENAALYKWFLRVASGDYAYRMNVSITLRSHDGTDVMTWQLENALPVKFKAADFNAKAGEIGIEELHLAHEGLSLSWAAA